MLQVWNPKLVWFGLARQPKRTIEAAARLSGGGPGLSVHGDQAQDAITIDNEEIPGLAELP